ncbi:MAG: phosphate/phosphite/phosphonate ABC transporter substrate-binding protein [Pseudomonadota bacterium]
MTRFDNPMTRIARRCWPRLALALGTGALALGLIACSPTDAPSVAKTGDRPLKLAYIPGEEDPEGRMEAFSDLAAYLTEALGEEVELIQAVSYAPTIEALRASKIDFMRSGGPYTYLIAHEKAGAEAILSVGTDAGPGLYQSMLVAWPGSNIKTLEDLVARAGEIDFAFVDPASTSGHLIPRARLEQAGIDPDTDFGRTIFTMSHTNSAMAIMSGKVQAGAMSFKSYERLLKAGHMKEGDIRILWKSEPILTGPVMVRPDLPAELKDRLRNAYLALNESDLPVYEAMKKVYKVDDLRFYPASDSDWDGLRAIARNVQSFDMMPGGR